jgi:hypothetical protein
MEIISPVKKGYATGEWSKKDREGRPEEGNVP